MDCFDIKVRCLGQTKRLKVRAGISSEELAEVLRASFQLSVDVVGFEDQAASTIYPLSLLSLDPAVFPARATLSLLLRYSEDEFDAPGPPEYDDIPPPPEEASSDDEVSGGEDEEEELPILEYIQQNTAFSRIPMDEILKVFRRAASEKGCIDKLTFETCFEQVCRDAGDKQDKKILKLVANKVFAVFDKDGNGVVDHSEFVAGLSLLCRASSDDKIRAAFNLFDLDGDGFVTKEEMLRYMVSFFEVCFTLDASMKNKFGSITAKQVGRATANHCFQKADVNKDGEISFEEFRDWCNSDDTVVKGVVGGYLD